MHSSLFFLFLAVRRADPSRWEAAEVTDALIENETINFPELYQMAGKYTPEF